MVRRVVTFLMAALSASLLLPSGSGEAEATGSPRAHRTTVIELTSLPTGQPPPSLYAVDNVIHDGDRTVRVQLTRPLRLLDRVVGGYAVQTIGPSGFYGKLYRVDPQTGVATKFGRSSDLYREPRVMKRGRFVAYGTCCAPPMVTVRDVTTGHIVAKRVFPQSSDLVDAGGSRVLVSGDLPDRDPAGRGSYWFPFSDRVKVWGDVFVSPFNADARHGLAYIGRTARACPELVRTADPQHPLWRGCHLVVIAFSPDAQTVLTVPFDGADGTKGVAEVQVRSTADGSLIHAYTGVDMNPVHYDGEDHLVLVAHSGQQTAAVRCDFTGQCALASAVVPEPRYEYYRLDWSFPANREGWAEYDETYYYDDY